MRRRKRVIPAAALDVFMDLLPEGCGGVVTSNAQHRIRLSVGDSSTYRVKLFNQCDPPLGYGPQGDPTWEEKVPVAGPCLRRQQDSQVVQRRIRALQQSGSSSSLITTTVTVLEQFGDQGWVALTAAPGHSGSVQLKCKLS